jgi:tartrate-resistant acid phosphatase type 5
MAAPMIVLLQVACQPPSAVEPETSGVGRDDDTDVSADTAARADTDRRPASLVATQPGLAQPGSPLRFVVLGDAGLGNRAQYEVGAAIADICTHQGCDFALYLGDNFYRAIPSDVDDPLFQEIFERPYAAAWFPFWAVLGNHDYGDVFDFDYGQDLDETIVEPEIAYTNHSDKWTMPGRYYDFVRKNVLLVGLDTEAILFGDSDDQAALVDRDAGFQGWKIAFGHHPYVSNGFHGNAGAYDGLDVHDPDVAVQRGDNVKAFFDDHICGHFDVYFSGHDHNRQWLAPRCGTRFLVSGSASRPSPSGDVVNRTRYAEYDKPGFLWVEIDGDTMRVQFYDAVGNLDFEGSERH